jgi:flagellar hook-associated protein 2
MARVQLGNFFSFGGRTYLGGAGGSGLDTETLIKGLSEAKRLPAVKLEDRIKLNDKKVAALAQFHTLLSKLKDSVNSLRNPPGVANAANNAFQFRTTTVTSNTAVAGSTYLSVSASPGASLQNYSVSEITALARAKKQTTGTFAIANANTAVVSDTPGPNQFKAGTFTLNDREVTFAVGDTLATVAAKINAVSSGTTGTGIVASVIRVGDNAFTLSLAASKTGTDADFDFNNVDVPDTLDDPNDVFDNITITTQTIAGVLQTAQDAQFKLNGTTITRQSNTITDIVDGVTFNLLQTTPVGPPVTTLDVAIKPDNEIAKNAIINFASAYNDLKLFYAKQIEVSPEGIPTEDAVLGNSTVLRTTMSTITSQLSSIVGGISSGYNRLADLGFSSADLPESDDNPLVRNIINIDDGKLAAAISGNFEQVRRVFEFDFNTDNPNLRIFSRNNASHANSFSMTINPYATQTTKTLEVADADTPIVIDPNPNAFQFKVGTVTINGQDIEFEAGDTLNMLAQKFNDVTGDTGVAAEVVEVEAGKFKLKFTTTVTNGVNQDFTSDAVDPDNIFADMDIEATPSFKATYIVAGAPVTVDVDGAFFTDQAGNKTGISLKGKSGTLLDGMVMVYSSMNASIVQISATQGIADTIFNTSDDGTKLGTGPIALESQALKSSDDKLQTEIARIDEQVERFRQQLIDKFSALEQAISRVNTLLDAIDAQNQVRNNSN